MDERFERIARLARPYGRRAGALGGWPTPARLVPGAQGLRAADRRARGAPRAGGYGGHGPHTPSGSSQDRTRHAASLRRAWSRTTVFLVPDVQRDSALRSHTGGAGEHEAALLRG
jgi:hypothetical protein